MIEIARKEEKSKLIVKNKKVDRFLAKTDKAEFRDQEELTVAAKQLKYQRCTNTILGDLEKEIIKFDYWFHPDIPGAAKIVS